MICTREFNKSTRNNHYLLDRPRSSVSSCLTNSLRANELDKHHEQRLGQNYLSNRSRSLNSAAVPSSSTGGADLPIHRTMSGKADDVAEFPKSRINRNFTQEDRTAGKMDKITQVSVAAIFSRRFS